ncbi:MAG: 23S rRNA (uracil(1939)-C(5))-methyltransferase RlmD [Bacilli bacterium]|nr:23S rRNA (uracil(1939)-C(5))-methyltransferase RlmD [Bacilli bacterium]MBN2876867.1 23S rRNA (uracil(1939)-C(5))-methyltransferase RlmD [Bacilli bacterium]
MEIEQKENYIVKAIDLTHDALGVARLEDGYTVFVEGLLKGETAKIEIVQRKKKYGFAKVVELITKSPYRLAPKCKHFYECGGCGLMHMDYDVQVAFKKYRLDSMVKKLGQDPTLVDDIICMVNPFYYRNKVEIKFAQGKRGIKAGYFRAKTHHVVDLDECYTMSKKSFEVLKLIKTTADELGLKAYNPETNEGILKSCVIRESYKNKEIVLLFNIATDSFKTEQLFANKIASDYPMVKGIGVVKSEDESAFSMDEIRVLFGKSYLTEELLGNTFEVGFRSFFQVNTIQTERLYKKAIEYAKFNGQDRVIDAYCGIGSVALSIANDVYKVFGIEIIEPAIVDAKKNAKINNIKNAFFEVGDSEYVIQKWKKYHFDGIIIDPPRKGCSKSFVDTLVNMKIPKIVYISCNPATLQRDLEYFLQSGYQLKGITPVDMFPQTTHVESVALLELK